MRPLEWASDAPLVTILPIQDSRGVPGADESTPGDLEASVVERELWIDRHPTQTLFIYLF